MKFSEDRPKTEKPPRPQRTVRLAARALGSVLVVVAAVVAIALWPLHRPPQHATVEIASLPRLSRPMRVRPVRTIPAVPRRNPFAGTLPAVHVKLRRWLETKTDDTPAQDQLMQELRAMLTDENAAGIAQSLSADELDTPFGAAVLERWLNVDAARAAVWVGGRPEATDAQAWLVARQLLPDPAALQACCDRLPETAWKQNYLAAACLQEAARAPAGAIDLAQRMQPGPDRTNVLQTIAYDWVGADPTAAMDWIARVTDPSLRESLTAAGVKALAATDPDLAAGWLASAVQSAGIANETALSIAEIWVDQDPAKAAAWVARFPAGNTRETAIGGILYHWLGADPGAATDWFLNLPDRDAVLARLTSDQAAIERAAEAK